MVLITSNNEKELPDAFLRRCIFYYIEFPDPPLMRKIIAVHHPHLDAKLLDQVLIKFYWLREQSELRKKPSTSELIDWISALLRSGVSMDKLEAHIPFIGALLKTEQDVDALQPLRQKGGRYPASWADLGPRYNQSWRAGRERERRRPIGAVARTRSRRGTLAAPRPPVSSTISCANYLHRAREFALQRRIPAVVAANPRHPCGAPARVDPHAGQGKRRRVFVVSSPLVLGDSRDALLRSLAHRVQHRHAALSAPGYR